MLSIVCDYFKDLLMLKMTDLDQSVINIIHQNFLYYSGKLKYLVVANLPIRATLCGYFESLVILDRKSILSHDYFPNS